MQQLSSTDLETYITKIYLKISLHLLNNTTAKDGLIRTEKPDEISNYRKIVVQNSTLFPPDIYIGYTQ